jgi:phage gp36-like protein
VPVTTYATVAQFFAWGLPQTALGARTTADVESALEAASADMDDCFRGRFPLPFLAVGLSVSRRCVYHARYLVLGGRGFSPVTGADQDILDAEKAVQEWLDKVQRRVLFPDVTIDPSATLPTSLDPSGSAQPYVITSSVVDVSTGRTATNRGW